MATTNADITSVWTKVADAAADRVLITGVVQDPVEFATVDGAVAPVVAKGHRLKQMADGEGITRDLIGPGHIYARLSGNRTNTVTLVVS